MDGVRTAGGGGRYGGDGLGSIGVDGRSRRVFSRRTGPLWPSAGAGPGKIAGRGCSREPPGPGWRGRWVGRLKGQWPPSPSGWEWNGLQPGQGAAELGFPGPAPGEMQSEAARRAGEPPGEGEEASPDGLGGHDLLAQTEPGHPTGQVVGHPTPSLTALSATDPTPPNSRPPGPRVHPAASGLTITRFPASIDRSRGPVRLLKTLCPVTSVPMEPRLSPL